MNRIGLIGALIIAAGLPACFDLPVEPPMKVDPVIQTVTLEYSASARSLYFAARIVDPQGADNIDSVWARLFRLDSANAAEGALFFETPLFDNGQPPHDIIIADNLYSHRLDSAALANAEGWYKATFYVIDADGHTAEANTPVTAVQDNTPPELFLLLAPTSFEKGDTLKFKIRLSDRQGTAGASITYAVRRPDGDIFTDPSFAMRDDGLNGDDMAGDGIFTVFQPSSRESKRQGLFRFYFVGRDRQGAFSDTLEVAVANPGVTLTYPNLQETFHPGQTVTITWESAYIIQLRLEYTTHANEAYPSYERIATVTAAAGDYAWVIPAAANSNYCRIRIYDPATPNREDVSDYLFRIVP